MRFLGTEKIKKCISETIESCEENCMIGKSVTVTVDRAMVLGLLNSCWIIILIGIKLP
jgi:hypothetical protein